MFNGSKYKKDVTLYAVAYTPVHKSPDIWSNFDTNNLHYHEKGLHYEIKLALINCL